MKKICEILNRHGITSDIIDDLAPEITMQYTQMKLEKLKTVQIDDIDKLASSVIDDASDISNFNHGMTIFANLNRKCQ